MYILGYATDTKQSFFMTLSYVLIENREKIVDRKGQNILYTRIKIEAIIYKMKYLEISK